MDDHLVDLLPGLSELPSPRNPRHRPDHQVLPPGLREEENAPFDAKDRRGGGGDEVEAVLQVLLGALIACDTSDLPRPGAAARDTSFALPGRSPAQGGGEDGQRAHPSPSSLRTVFFNSVVSWDFTM